MEEMEVYCVSQEGSSPKCYVDIYNYLKDQIILETFDKNEKVRLKKTTLKYVIIGYILYKKSFDGALLRCLTHHEIEATLQ